VPITIRPVGGLGNQLFIYATGSTVAGQLGVELWADIQHFDSNPTRSYLLNRFPSRVAKVIKGDSVEAAVRGRIFRKLSAIGRKSSSESVQKERGFWFDPDILTVTDGTTITGYLQSWKYFHTDSQRIRTEILNPTHPSEWFSDMREKVVESEPWIGVHVRRGDYVEIPQMGITTDYYYSRALRIVEKLTGEMKTIVFSDDTDAARGIPSLKNRKNTEFFESPANSCPLENLIIMSHSNHLIGANSSFSWWAGWLQDREDRVVTYPRPWIDFRFINDRDLQLPNWIGLGRESPSAALQNHVGY